MTNKRKYTRSGSKSPASSPTVALDNKRISAIKRKLQLARTSSVGERYRNRNQGSESETKEDGNEFSIPKIDLRTQRAQSDGDLTFIEQNMTDDENQSTVTSLPSVVGYYGKLKKLFIFFDKFKGHIILSFHIYTQTFCEFVNHPWLFAVLGH